MLYFGNFGLKFLTAGSGGSFRWPVLSVLFLIHANWKSFFFFFFCLLGEKKKKLTLWFWENSLSSVFVMFINE